MMKGPHQGMQGFQKAVLWKALFFLLAGILPPGAAAAQLIDPPGDADPAKTWEALLDSLRSEPDSLIPWNESAPEEWVKPGEIAWIPDASDSTTAKGRDGASTLSFDIQPVFGFSKVDGATPGFKLSLSTKKEPDIHLCGVLRRGLEAGRWEGFGLAGVVFSEENVRGLLKSPETRLTGGGRGGPGSPQAGSLELLQSPGWGFITGWSDQPVPFGSNRPYGTTPLGGLMGLDHQSYLERREIAGGLLLRGEKGANGGICLVHREDRSLKAVSGALFELDDDNMKLNPSADAVELNGVILDASIRGRFDLQTGTRAGLWARVGLWGGTLEGDREFYTAGIEGRTSFKAPLRGELFTEFWAGAVGGHPPVQELMDLGGEQSLRAYPPRFDTGAGVSLLRLDYVFGIDPLYHLRIPILKNLRLQPVIFADAGAVWGDKPWSSLESLQGPESGDYRFDVGLGIQRFLGFPGFLSHIRIEAGWRLDRSRDRMRWNVSLKP